MSMPAAKRQRTDAASYALSKPFRSPMKTPSAASTSKTPFLVLQESSDPAQSGDDDTTKTLELTKFLPQPIATPLGTRATKNPFSTPISSTAFNADPDIAALIKTQRQLEKQLRELKEELDTAEQARRIEAESEKTDSGQIWVGYRAASRARLGR
jgi:Swi5-dependent recombination DNA repair protein 1